MLRSADISFALDNNVHYQTDYMDFNNNFTIDEIEDADIKQLVDKIH